MQKPRKAPDRSALSRYGPPWPLPRAWPPERLYRQVFDPPALSVIAEARREAEKYRERLRECYGPDVPGNEIDDFKDGFLDGCKRPGASLGYVTDEGYAVGFRAGQRWKQRQRADATTPDETEVFLDDAMRWYAEGPTAEQNHIERRKRWGAER